MKVAVWCFRVGLAHTVLVPSLVGSSQWMDKVISNVSKLCVYDGV